MTSPTRISQIQTLHRELVCKETPAGATLCRTIFAIKLVELNGLVGLIIEYGERRIYLPPIVNDKVEIPLPKKYAKYFDSTIFPELTFVNWGRI